MPDSAVFCPGCGHSMQTPERAQAKIGILSENVAGALAYFTFIPATAFLLLAPYSKNRFVRFQCLQSLFLTLICLLLGVTLKLASPILFLVPLVGPLFVSLVSIVGALAAVMVWLVLVVKAFQGEVLKLPVLGELAERRANLIPERPL
jgi:uncharacterized membrane protein